METNNENFYEIKTDNEYKSYIENNLLLTITKENNIYTAKNDRFCITAEIIPLDDYRTQCKLISNKLKTKNGYYRETKTLASSNLSWLHYILEKTNFIRKTKCVR